MADDHREWRSAQVFGDKAVTEEITDSDIVSAVSFDHTGEYLATGDKGGRIVIFKRKHGASSRPRTSSASASRLPQYDFFTEFQSHEAEFDYLKSQEIEEKINQIQWCKPSNGALFLLSTNDKTVKLWKVHERPRLRLSGGNKGRAPRSSADLVIPRVSDATPELRASPRRVYANAHAYHINSISLNSDGETFMSVDDLRINLWNLERSDSSFNIVDIKPENMEELTEVITAADFHPHECNLFAYSSSRGTVKLADMRAAALCENHSKLFHEAEDPSAKSFFSEIIASISDVKFSPDGRHLVSRDYLTLKLWDIRMESRPLKGIHIHDYLRSKLCELYENDCIFDKFELAVSSDGMSFVTGSYGNMFHIYDSRGAVDHCIEAPKPPSRKLSRGGPYTRKKPPDLNVNRLNFGKKAMHVAWHPQEDTVAVAGLNNLFLYSKT